MLYRHERAVGDFTTALRHISPLSEGGNRAVDGSTNAAAAAKWVVKEGTRHRSQTLGGRETGGIIGDHPLKCRRDVLSVAAGEKSKGKTRVDEDKKQCDNGWCLEHTTRTCSNDHRNNSDDNGVTPTRILTTTKDAPAGKGDGNTYAERRHSSGSGGVGRFSVGGRDDGDGVMEGASLAGACHYARYI